MSYFPDKKIFSVTWLDEQKSTVQWNIVNSNNIIESEALNTSDPAFVELVEIIGGVDNIDKMTENQNAVDGKFLQDMDDYLQHKDKEKEIVEKLVETERPLSLSRFMDDYTQEELFKLKLEIFEMNEISETAPREVKSKLRKSKSIFELFAVLYNYQNAGADSK